MSIAKTPIQETVGDSHIDAMLHLEGLKVNGVVGLRGYPGDPDKILLHHL
jgi:hypothetical protein